MTFLNPSILWALFAVAIPIIVHFFNFRKPKKVLFSNISMVKEVQKSVVRRLRLQQWLLLLARIIAIVALVLVFANPVILREGDAALRGGSSSVVLVVDNSYSMESGNEKGSYWPQALNIAREIIDSYSKEDEFLIMASNDLRLNYNFGDQQEAMQALNELQIRQNLTPYTELLKLQEDLFKKASDNNNRILYFLSDFQESTVLSDSLSTAQPDSGIRYYFIPMSTRAQRNVYLADLEIKNRVIDPGTRLQMGLTLINDGEEPVRDLGVSIKSENIEEPGITVPKLEGKVDSLVSFRASGAGWQSGMVQIDEPNVYFDNQRYFSYYVPKKEKFLVVEGQRSTAVRAIYSALAAAEQFDVTFISDREFGTTGLEEFKGIALVGVDELSTGLQDQLIAHLKAGRGLMFFPGKGMKKDNINGFFSKLGIGAYRDEIKVKEGIKSREVDLDHPIFDGVFKQDDGVRQFDHPTFYRYFRFQPENTIIQNSILGVDGNTPMISESFPENGVCYTFSFFPDSSWSDFPLKSVFAPIMMRTSHLMNSTQNVTQSQNLGDLRPVRVKTAEKDLIKMIRQGSKPGEEGAEVIPLQNVEEGFIVLRFDPEQLKEGNYNLVQNGKTIQKISFNVPDQESKLKAPNQEGLEKFLAGKGLSSIRISPPDPNELVNEIQVQKKGVPLWKWFLILVILALLAELLILRLPKKS